MCLIAYLLNRPNLTSLVILTMVIFGLVSLLTLTIVTKDLWRNRNVAQTSSRKQRMNLIICESAIYDCEKVNPSSNNTTPQHLPPWSDYLAKVSITQFQPAPVILRVYCDAEDSDIFVQSNPFYTFEGGHLMNLRAYLNGHGKGKSTHVSVYLHLMKGPYDDELEYSGHWPLRGTFIVQILNQLNECEHHDKNITDNAKLPHEYTNRAGEDDIAAEGWGKPQFISHDLLKCNCDCCYYMNNILYFRVSYENNGHQIAPAILRYSNLNKNLKEKKEWYSSPFFAFEGGYQMCLRIDAAGYGDGKSTHVSVYLYLMTGPHDDQLEQSGNWPLRGTFTIELLNQLNNSDHYTHIVQFTTYTGGNFANRVLKVTEPLVDGDITSSYLTKLYSKVATTRVIPLYLKSLMSTVRPHTK